MSDHIPHNPLDPPSRIEIQNALRILSRVVRNYGSIKFYGADLVEYVDHPHRELESSGIMRTQELPDELLKRRIGR